VPLSLGFIVPSGITIGAFSHATNFFTYIDTDNTKASLAQRGHSKEKRTDLKIVGLSVMLSDEDEIPLFYNVYSGNKNDAEQFTESVSIMILAMVINL
jgi:transposase